MALPSLPIVKRYLKAAKDMGLTINGYEALPDGGVRVLTGATQKDGADDALAQWMKSHGKD